MRIVLTDDSGTVVDVYIGTEFYDIEDLFDALREDIPIYKEQGKIGVTWKPFEDEDEET